MLDIKKNDNFIFLLNLPFFFILALSLFIRVYSINHFDLWFDELCTNIFSSQFLHSLQTITDEPVKELFIANLKNDPNSSLYYIIVYFFSSLFGNAKHLRYLSLFFSVSSLIVFYALSKEFFSKRESLCALLLLALNPFHVWYAQEARVYAGVCFFSLVTIFLYIRCLRKNRIFYWIAFIFFTIITLLLSYHFVSILIISFLGVFLISDKRGKEPLLISAPPSSFSSHKISLKSFLKENFIFKRWLISVFLISLVFLFITSFFLTDQLSYVKNSFWLKAPTLGTIFHTIKVFTFGHIELNIKYFLGVGFFIFLFVMGISDAFKKQKGNTVILAAFLFFPVFFIFVVSRLIFPIYITRQLIFASQFYWLFIGVGLANLKGKNIRYGALALAILLLTCSIVDSYRGVVPSVNDFHRLDGVFTRKKYHDLVLDFRNQFRPGDLIVSTDILSTSIIFFEIINNDKIKNYNPKMSFKFFFKPDFLDPTEQRYVKVDNYVKGLSPSDRKEIYSSNFMFNSNTRVEKVGISNFPFQRIWFISSNFGMENFLIWNEKEVLDFLKEKYQEISSAEKDGIVIKLLIKNDQ